MHCSQIRSSLYPKTSYDGVTMLWIQWAEGRGVAPRSGAAPALTLSPTSQCRKEWHVVDNHDIMGVQPMNAGDCILLTMREAAGALTMSKRTLERLMAAREFPQPLRFTSRCVRVPASDVDAYIERQLRRRNAGRAQP